MKVRKLKIINRSQSCDFRIYKYNAGVVVGLDVSSMWKIIIVFLKHALLLYSCGVNFYNTGVVTRDRRIESWRQSYDL
jgi:hypothetical protein